MPKGYWIVRVDVSNADEYAKYTVANPEIFGKFGGRFLARGGRSTAVAGPPRARNVIVSAGRDDTSILIVLTVRHLADGATEKSTGEIHFGWVLEGRAIQDIWIRPRRPAPSTMYGTTLRIFDPGIDGWHVIWCDPLNQDYSRQIGRAAGKDIVQIGEDSRGLKARWRFTEITADSFHWIGEERSSDSDPWKITYEHFARRADP